MPHITLPDIKDFNALYDVRFFSNVAFCFKRGTGLCLAKTRRLRICGESEPLGVRIPGDLVTCGARRRDGPLEHSS